MLKVPITWVSQKIKYFILVNPPTQSLKMPYVRCRPSQQLQFYFVTAGPLNFHMPKEILQDQVDVVLRAVHGSRIQRCAYAFETASDGYNHVHIALHLNRPVRFAKMANRLKRMIDATPKDPDETRKTNCGVFYPPRDIQDPYANMLKYLTCPTKSKEVGGVIEFEVPNFANMQVIWPGYSFTSVKEFVDDMIRDELVRSQDDYHKNYGYSPHFLGWSNIAQKRTKMAMQGKLNEFYQLYAEENDLIYTQPDFNSMMVSPVV